METNTSSVWEALRRRWPIIALFTVLGAVIGALPAPDKVQDQERSYVATTSIEVRSPAQVVDQNVVVSPELLPVLVGSTVVAGPASEALGEPEGSLVGDVQAAFDVSSGTLQLTTTQDTEERAVAVADAFAGALDTEVQARQQRAIETSKSVVQERVDQLTAEIAQLTADGARFRDPETQEPLPGADADPAYIELQARLSSKQNQLEEAQTRIDLLDTAQVTTLEPIGNTTATEVTQQGLGAPTSRTTRAILGGLVGAAIGAAIAMLLSRLDRKIRSIDQLERAAGLKVRAVVPVEPRREHGELVVVPERHDALADAYRAMRALLAFLAADLPPRPGGRVVLVVSPGPGDGKTSVAANVAAAFAESGARTIAVNTDFRRPSLVPRLLGGRRLQWDIGLEEVNRRSANALVVPSTREDLAVMDLSSVRAQPGDLARGTASRVDDLRTLADVIVVDTSPVRATAEVLEMVPLADLVVIVTRLGHTPTASARRTVETVQALSRAELVLTLVGATAKAGYYDYYASYYAPLAAGSDGKKRGRFRRSKG